MRQSIPWTILDKIGFRFIFIYFLLYIALQNNNAYPFWLSIFKYPLVWVRKFIPWISENFYGIPDVVFVASSGSTDKLFDYLLLITIFLVSLFGCIIWTILDRNREHYTKLFYWLCVALRYYIALMLLDYGLIKIFDIQFPYPSPYRMLNTIGETSPMGLAWTFFGYSKGYKIIVGILEIMAVFLLFRRTLSFGLIITLMTTINVMLLNLFYDVSVKLTTIHMVLMTLFLLSKDINPLWLLFFKQTKVKLTKLKRPVFSPTFNITLNTFKAIIIGYAVIHGLIDSRQTEKLKGYSIEKPFINSAYKVTTVLKNKDSITNYRDNRLWSSISFLSTEHLSVKRYSEPIKSFYSFKKDSLQNLLLLKNYHNPNDTIKLYYEEKDTITYHFAYVQDDDTITIETKKYTKEDFLLSERKFMWISETTFNR